jgi:hypothetical protein
MLWDGPILTDSGGFQIFSLADRAKITEQAATFRSHIDGSLLELSPERAIQELGRTLRPGGELWVDALNAECLPTRLNQSRERASGRSAHLRYDTPHELVRVFGEAGFSDLRVHWVPIRPARMRKLRGTVGMGWIRAILAAAPPLGSAFSHAFVVVGKRAGGA